MRSIVNHTWNHLDLKTLAAYAQAREIARSSEATERLALVRACVFRPPYGSYDSTSMTIATDRLLSFWMWSVDTEDWKAEGSASSYWVHRIVTRAEAGATQPHPVILMHNSLVGNPATVAALLNVISYYRNHGYQFVLLR